MLIYNAETPARILIVDDHPIVRQGVAMLINQEPDLRVCCEASNAEEGRAMNLQCKPHLAIVDLSLAGLSGLELIKQLRVDTPELLILMMSMHDESVYAERVLQAGAQGYLMKQETPSTMLQAIRQVLHGEIYLSPSMHNTILHRLVHHQGDNSPIRSLSSVEFEVLHLIGLGYGTSEIARMLDRSPKTIEAHRANIKSKLKLSSGADLNRFAINWTNGLIPLQN
jgi:DNA-binding NarL/FixJ family response regulator